MCSYALLRTENWLGFRAGERKRELPTHRIALGLLAAGLALAGCGDDEDFANEPRPPVPINVSANIQDGRVTVDPTSFGAGPVTIFVANLTDRTHRATIDARTGDLEQTTAAINPGGTARLRVDLDEGRYSLSAGGGVRPARIDVGEQRPSAQDQLLQP